MKAKIAKKQIKKLIETLSDKDLSSSADAGLKNLLYYFDTIWNDRWYDYSFLLNMLERKLKNMESNWKKSIYVGMEKDYKDIKKARKLLKLLIKDEFYDKYDEQLDKEYGELRAEHRTTDGGMVSTEFFRDKEMDKEYEIKVDESRAASEKDKKKVKNKFFKLLKKYEKWWD